MTDKNWKKSAADRRDQRHTKAPEKNQTSFPNTKDTKRWCRGRGPSRGKKGVEHQPVCHIYADAKSVPEKDPRYDLYRKWRLLVCSCCGRELDFYLGGKDKPAWVDK